MWKNKKNAQRPGTNAGPLLNMNQLKKIINEENIQYLREQSDDLCQYTFNNAQNMSEKYKVFNKVRLLEKIATAMETYVQRYEEKE